MACKFSHSHHDIAVVVRGHGPRRASAASGAPLTLRCEFLRRVYRKHRQRYKKGTEYLIVRALSLCGKVLINFAFQAAPLHETGKPHGIFTVVYLGREKPGTLSYEQSNMQASRAPVCRKPSVAVCDCQASASSAIALPVFETKARGWSVDRVTPASRPRASRTACTCSPH